MTLGSCGWGQCVQPTGSGTFATQVPSTITSHSLEVPSRRILHSSVPIDPIPSESQCTDEPLVAQPPRPFPSQWLLLWQNTAEAVPLNVGMAIPLPAVSASRLPPSTSFSGDLVSRNSPISYETDD